MYKHILLPVEFGDVETYKRAYDIASRLLDEGGKITLMHAVEPVPNYVESYVTADVAAQTRARLEEQMAQFAARFDTSETALVDGAAGRAIVDWAEESKADCIVITSHRPAFSDLFLGSTAAWVVRHAATSIHVLR